MDDSDLIAYYKEKAKEWIYQGKTQHYTIEDDEILDLDSLSLSSNEDTWLYSSPKIGEYDNVVSNLTSSKFVDETFNDVSLTSSFSPLIDLNNCSDSLIHLPDISTSVIDRFLTTTPQESKKSKSYLQTVLTNQFHNRLVDNQNESLLKSKTDCTFPDGVAPDTVKKNYSNDSEKNYVLHSVENKLFTITDADIGENFNQNYKSLQNRDYINGDCGKKIPKNERNTPSPDKADLENKTDKVNEKINRVSKTQIKIPETVRSPISVLENDENINRSKKIIPLCQSTPMLLNRYLKYNKTIEETKNFSQWRTSSEFLKEVEPENCGFEKTEMNVSYIKEKSVDNENLPYIENLVSNAEIEDSKTNLNTTYSKSDCVLNSTLDINIEDDQTSSTSESSFSSYGNKHPLSIQDVQKLADMQERSLKKQIYSGYYAGSSKSSEISSSNESISAMSPISSSNEGQINPKTKTIQRISIQKPITRVQRPVNDTFNCSKATTINFVKPIQYDKTSEHKLVPNTLKETKLTNIFKNKVINSTSPQKPTAKEPSRISGFTSNFKEDVHESVNMKQIQTDKNSTFISKLPGAKAPEKNEEPSRCSSSPVSHIPRPSSRIPMFRASSSCTRYSKSSTGLRK